MLTQKDCSMFKHDDIMQAFPRVAEWPIAPDCKSGGFSLRRFESYPLDQFYSCVRVLRWYSGGSYHMTLPQLPPIKFIFLSLLAIGIGVGSVLVYSTYFSRNIASPIPEETKAPTANPQPQNKPPAPVLGEPDFEGVDASSAAKSFIASKAQEKQALAQAKIGSNDPSDKTKPFTVAVVGIDRRSGEQTSWRTDVIQIVTIAPSREKTVITHIPRDVWSGTYKINAVYNLRGPDSFKDEIAKITGYRPDRIIRFDFDAFVYLVDAAGGVTVNVPTAFTDSSYPNDRKGINEPITVEFKAGEQVMDGERALIYTRSRKGTNGEGSDYARGTRQQIVMRAWVADFFKPSNLFQPKTAQKLYEVATKNAYTDLSLADAAILFEVMKNYKTISVQQLSLDTSNYLEVPTDKSSFGGQWVLAPKGGNYQPIHDKINELLK